MKFEFHVSDDLPKLAWCATIQKGADTARVLQGPWVEKRESFFCEGAWDGEFRKGEFEKGFLAGSGCQITDDGNLLFVSPNHTLERLHSIKVSDAFYISNSLAFLLSAIDDELDPGFFFYRSVLHSIRCGLKKCGHSIPTKKGRRVSLHYYCNLLVSPDLITKEIPKTVSEDFLNYGQYTRFLNETITDILRNAADKNRTIHFQPIASVSTGYDSVAAAVLARNAGCSEAITFADSNDSGAEIARILGMNIKEYDRREYFKYDGYPEAEFWAVGMSASFTTWLAWEHDLQQRLLFTGFNGEIVWDKYAKPITRDMERDSPFADARTGPCGLTEFRLRTGFLHLPVPYIGMTSQPSIYSISVSQEMKPWSIGTSYDRPIPRRIAEDAGIDRNLFGMEKKGAWLPDARLTDNSETDFKAFYSERWSLGRRILARVINLFAVCYAYAWIIRYRAEQLAKKAGLRVNMPTLLPKALSERLLLRVGRISLMPHWGISKISERYLVSDSTISRDPLISRRKLDI